MIWDDIEQKQEMLEKKKPGQSARAKVLSNLLRDRFLLDDHFQMRGNFFVQLHRHSELAQGL